MILKNDKLCATISSFGAELKSIKDNTETEYLWQADAKFWNKTSPVLFPIVGSLKNSTYLYNETEYKLPRHGFARDYEFEAIKISETEASFTLSSTAETLKKYPFLFKLNINYKLIANSVICSYQIHNLGENNMPFSIGAHPAFALKHEIADYYLHFNNDTQLNRLELTPEGLIKSTQHIIELKNKNLPLSFNMFYNDALVFRDLKSTEVAINNNKTNKQLSLSFNGFTHFGIWSAPNAPFICLEPWCGIADLEDHNQKIEEKEGILLLKPNTNIIKEWIITIN